jgi:HdeA/HdeB family
MLKIAFATAAALALAAPAFSQDLKALTCADYNAADQAKKSGYAASMQGLMSEMDIREDVTSNDVTATLEGQCDDNPDALLVDVLREHLG